MSWVSYLFPQTVARYSTMYNGDVRVLLEHGEYKLLANGSRQSGEYVKKLWEYAFSEFGIIPSPSVRSVLVLGVAGGDAIRLLHAMYPDALITGVDIDPTMLDIGKKYFRLGDVSNLRLVVADAKEYIQMNHTWDLILCDTHIGATIPPFVGEEPFLRSVKKNLAPGGIFIINYLREFEYEKLSDLLMVKLRKIFRTVKDARIYFNRFFRCM